MAETQLLQSNPQLRPWWLRRGGLIAFWLASGLLMATVAYLTPLERTQEARVLVGAREMLGAGWRAWIIPHVNARVRIQKPPLAYWASATSFKVLGVSTFAGRVPMVLCTWLTIALVWFIARRLANHRAAFFAAAAFAGSFFTLRFGRLAETDTLALPLLTLATWAFWRAVESPQRQARWFHLSSVCIGLAANAKGLSAVLPLVAFVGFAWSARRWGAIRDWVKCGAPITLVLVAAPWWAFVALQLGFKTFLAELRDVSTGRDHGGWPWLPLGDMLAATLPWTGFVLLAIAAAATHWRKNAGLRGLLIWTAAILVPLCILPQKQAHYILPILPPLMILVGWLLDRAIGGLDPPLRKATIWVLGATTLVGLLGAASPVVGGWLAHHTFRPVDLTMSALMAAGMILLIILYHRRGLLPALCGAMVVGGLLMAATIGIWGPSIQGANMASVARQIKAKYGDGPYAFYPIENMPLSFELRRVIPTYLTLGALIKAQAHGRLIVICEENDQPVTMPPGMAEPAEFPMPRKVIRVGQLNGR